MKCSCKLLHGKRVAGLQLRFLSGLPAADLGVILSAATHRKFPKPSLILYEDDPAERVFLLTSGLGRHFVFTGNGRRVLLHWLTAGQVFGGMAMLSGPSNYLAS